MNEYLTLFLNAGGAVAVSGLALYYIDRMSTRFGKTVDTYMTQKLDVDRMLAEKIQHFADTSIELKNIIKEQKNVLEKMYIEMAHAKGHEIKNKKGR